MTERARLLPAASTPSERSLWEALRDRRLAGTKWRRQQKLGRFVLDFFCADHRLAIEIDGAIHLRQQAADAERQRVIELSGVRVVRVSASDIETELPTGLRRVEEMLAAPSPLVGEGANGRSL